MCFTFYWSAPQHSSNWRHYLPYQRAAIAPFATTFFFVCFFLTHVSPCEPADKATLQADKKDTSLDESGGCNCARSARLKAPSHTPGAVKWMSDEPRSMCGPEATEAEIKGGRPAKTHSGWAAVAAAGSVAVSLLWWSLLSAEAGGLNQRSRKRLALLVRRVAPDGRRVNVRAAGIMEGSRWGGGTSCRRTASQTPGGNLWFMHCLCSMARRRVKLNSSEMSKV